MNSIAATSHWWAAALIGMLGTAFFVVVNGFVRPRWRDRQLRRELDDSFDPETVTRATQHYVEPDCSPLDPTGAARRGIVLGMKSSMARMDEVLGAEAARRHHLLLADSGMGKTSFLLNYYEHNRRRRKRERFRLFLVALGQRNALEKLRAVEDKSETIALLDGLDEDARAIDDHRGRLNEILTACADFKRVVISCRTQFLAGDEEITRQAGVAVVGSSPAGQPNRYTLEKMYLAPLSERQKRTYVRRRLPWYQFGRRRRARALLTAMPDAMTRPMLLALVPELVDAGRRISEVFELYEFMVESWLERERDWIAPDVLRTASKKLALNLYLRASDGAADRMSLAELSTLAGLESSAVDRWRLTPRSLLTRDADGNFRFVHRPVLEYFFLRVYLDDGEAACLSPRWSDFVRQLFLSWVNVAEARSGNDFLRLVLKQDYTATGLFPLEDRHSSPARLSNAQMLEAAMPPDADAASASVARHLYVTEHSVEDAVYLCDRATDTVFYVAPDWRRVLAGAVDLDTARLFAFTRPEVDRQIAACNELSKDNRNNWRLPTLEELDLLCLWNLRTQVLPSHLYVWSDDQSEDGSRLVVRMCATEEYDEPRVNVIGMRQVVGGNDTSAKYLVSSTTALGIKDQRGHFDNSFRALIVRVSQGAAESFPRELHRAHA